MDATAIRKRIGALGPRRRGVRLPRDLQREIADYAQRRRSAGVRVSEIARETGVSEESVRRWTTNRARALSVVPVRLQANGTAGTGIVIHTAQGHRVTGLDVEGAVQVVRILG